MTETFPYLFLQEIGLYGKRRRGGGVDILLVFLQLPLQRTATPAVPLDNLRRPADKEFRVEHAVQFGPDRLL